MYISDLMQEVSLQRKRWISLLERIMIKMYQKLPSGMLRKKISDSGDLTKW